MRQKILLTFALLLILAQGTWAFSGSGTSESPYLIASASDWSTLASNVNSGTNYVGKSFRLTNDISVTTMVGSSESNSFRGTFDGYGHTLTINYNTTSDYTAPFRYIQGATFKNLKVTGSITTTMNLAAGIAGLNTGATATFEQCVTDIIINSSSSTVVGWGRYDYHGGLLARTIDVDAMITDCVCGGSVNGSSSSNSNCASFVGVAENCTVHATRCLSTTSYTNVNKWNSLSHCANAYRAVNVFYYVNANDAANVGEQVTTSQLADGTITTALQAGRATTVWTQYAAISQPMLRLFALNQANDGYYLIDSEQDWRNFAALIQTTPTANARMTADISVTTMVGSSDKPFSGIFNGDYHTLTVNISGSGEKTAPFCYVKEENGVTAVIRRLKVTGSISTADKFAGGIVGYSEGQVNIIGCGCSVTIHSTVNGDGSHGGLVGYSSGSLYIEGCTFTGKMLTTAGTYKCGGFIGWNGGATARMSSSLYAPAAIEGSETEVLNGPDGTISATFSRNGGTILNCYYTRTLGTAQGTQVYSITAGSDVTISGLSNASNTYPASGLTFYNPGIKCGDAYYARNGDAVGLNLSHGNKEGYTFNQYTISGGGSLANPTTNTPTLTMTDANQTINATWTENTATLTDGDDVATALLPYAGKTCTVTYTRSFTADKASTVCLPFAYTKKTGDGSFYAFSGIGKVGSEYIATMTEPGTSTLTANTPYLYKAETTGVTDFRGTYAIPSTIAAGTTTSGDWTFKGTYSTIEWTSAPAEHIYGFSAQAANDGIQQGQFVKVGSYVRIKPMRAYLQYNGSDSQFANARALMTRAAATTSDDTLPETIGVRLISANGEVTAIGTLHTRTGEVSFDSEAWYTLDGKRLNAKPNTKGIYVNNGKKVVIK